LLHRETLFFCVSSPTMRRSWNSPDPEQGILGNPHRVADQTTHPNGTCAEQGPGFLRKPFPPPRIPDPWPRPVVPPPRSEIPAGSRVFCNDSLFFWNFVPIELATSSSPFLFLGSTTTFPPDYDPIPESDNPSPEEFALGFGGFCSSHPFFLPRSPFREPSRSVSLLCFVPFWLPFVHLPSITVIDFFPSSCNSLPTTILIFQSNLFRSP